MRGCVGCTACSLLRNATVRGAVRGALVQHCGSVNVLQRRREFFVRLVCLGWCCEDRACVLQRDAMVRNAEERPCCLPFECDHGLMHQHQQIGGLARVVMLIYVLQDDSSIRCWQFCVVECFEAA